MLSSVLTLYVFIGLCWACETGLYWFACSEDNVGRAAGLFTATIGWPYEMGRGFARMIMGLKFFKEIN